MKKLIFTAIGLMISIPGIAEVHGVNLLAQSSAGMPSPSAAGKSSKASEKKGNVLSHDQRGSNLNLKRGQYTPLPPYKPQTNQPQANYPYNRSSDNQNYSNHPGFDSKGNALPQNQRGGNPNLKRDQHTPFSASQSHANYPYNSSLINQNYGNNPGLKRGRNIFTGRDQNKLNQGNARHRRGSRD